MGTLRILIIDDDRDLAESLAEYLALDGHAVDVQLSGKTGLEAAIGEAYDQIIMDIGLPDLDGGVAMREIRKAKPDSRILLISGHSAADLDPAVFDPSVAEVLTKPLDLERLAQRLAALPSRAPNDEESPASANR